MNRITIASIVEGDGEVLALPPLLYRIAHELGVWDLSVPSPHRLPRGKMIRTDLLENAVQAAGYRVDAAGGVLVLLDADDDCPASLGVSLLARAQAARPDKKVAVVVANKEFEAWFLAAAPSLAGQHDLPDTLAMPDDPEGVQDAKGWLSTRMDGHPYRPTTDQAALSRVFDMKAAGQHSPSFDKFWRDVERLMSPGPERTSDSA